MMMQSFVFTRKILFLTWLIIFMLSSVSCCFSNKNLDYTLLDMSSDETPKWIFDHSLIEKNDKIYEYFIGEYDDINKAKCKKEASLDAVEKIINKISQEIIKNNNWKIKQANLEKLKDNIRIKIKGIEKVTDYWEQRKYKYKKLSNTKNNKIYSCYKVVKIKKQLIKQLIEKLNESNLL